MKIALNKLSSLAWVAGLVAVLGMTTGCQMSIGGQTLPSAYYLKDDIQYFPKGPEFKLQREADALRMARGEESGS